MATGFERKLAAVSEEESGAQPDVGVTVLVAGDVAIDWLEESVQAAEVDADPSTRPNFRQFDGFRWTPRHGGAFLLANMVRSAMTQSNIDTSILQQVQVDPYSSEARSLLHSLARIELTDVGTNAPVRVSSFKGFSIPNGGAHAGVPPVPDAPNGAKVVIVDDAANGCRWDQTFVAAVLERIDRAELVLLKLSRPLERSPLLDLPMRPGRRSIVIINADDLRAHGVDISRRLSWERTALDVLRASKQHPVFQKLLQIGQVLVRLDCDGCVAVASAATTQLVFDPTGVEGGYAASLNGEMPGSTSAFVASLAAGLLRDPPPPNEPNPVSAVPAALKAAREIRRIGFVKQEDGRSYPTELFDARSDEFATVTLPDMPRDDWSILADRLVEDPKLPARIVTDGPDPTLSHVPTGQYQNLVLADRREIEAFRSIENLLREYMRSVGGRPQPLSIGVFGPPGAGKSFGIKRVVKSIGGGKIVERTFNLTQFDTHRDLVGAFHIARDIGLRGDMPMLIFDEFDCDFGGSSFGWLKYFLAPMQDAEFKDDGHIHPIGSAIFVFSGGVTHSFSEITSLARKAADKTVDPDSDVAKFKHAKGPDFVSRLRGHLDVLGINPYAEAATSDQAFAVRRALLFRTSLT